MSAPGPVSLTRVGVAGLVLAAAAFVCSVITVRTETGWLGWISILLMAATAVVLHLWAIAVGVSWGIRHARTRPDD